MQPTPVQYLVKCLNLTSHVCGLFFCSARSCYCVHVWVCMLPQGCISLYEILLSLAPSMGRKCESFPSSAVWHCDQSWNTQWGYSMRTEDLRKAVLQNYHLPLDTIRPEVM